MKPEPRRCAVYTRKSTEEGLDQEFNSIDAQREACFAYITSQKFAGWTPISTSYDDGGFSGGNMERPALQKLLNDVCARKIDVIVVYKIDRLSRTLIDFAKLLDLFEKYGVTFMSVTQSFNTTTSMGRLTMNILLSFAQFEREMTAERIRDKFAASKKKGIWMGGTTPTGYDVKNRQLVPNAEASFVKMVFERYLELGTIVAVMRDFKQRGIKSPLRTRMNGVQAGGYALTSGALRHMLMNPIYIGKIKHKTALYDGLHPPILPMDLWRKVQDRIKDQSLPSRREKMIAADPSLLQGKLFDKEGGRYTPHYVPKKGGNGEKHKYYISLNLAKKNEGDHMRSVYRLPANEIEDHASKTLRNHLNDPILLGKLLMVDVKKNFKILEHITHNSQRLTHLGKMITRVVVDAHQYILEIDITNFLTYASTALEIKTPQVNQTTSKVVAPFRPKRATRETTYIEPQGSEGDVELIFDLQIKDIKDLVRGVAWREDYFRGMHIGQIAARYGVSREGVDKLIQESFRKV